MSEPNYLRGNKRLKTLHSEMDYNRYDDIKRKKQKLKDKHDVPSRFHGAFTGGFSAGYFNTVGSAEGFVPSNKRLDIADYLDEEDYVNGIGLPTIVNTTTLASYQPVIEIEFNKETKEKLNIITELGIKNLGYTFKDEDISNLLGIENIESYNMTDFKKYEKSTQNGVKHRLDISESKTPLDVKLRGYEIEDEINYYEDDEYIISNSKGNKMSTGINLKKKKDRCNVDICKLLKSKSIVFDVKSEMIEFKSTPDSSKIWAASSRYNQSSRLPLIIKRDNNPTMLSTKFVSQNEAEKIISKETI